MDHGHRFVLAAGVCIGSLILSGCPTERVERLTRYWTIVNQCSFTIAVRIGDPSIDGEQMLYRNTDLAPEESVTLSEVREQGLELWVWVGDDTGTVVKRPVDPDGGTTVLSGSDCDVLGG